MVLLKFLIQHSLIQPLVTIITAFIALWSIWYTQQKFDSRQRKEFEEKDKSKLFELQRQKLEEVYNYISLYEAVLIECIYKFDGFKNSIWYSEMGDETFELNRKAKYDELISYHAESMLNIKKASMITNLYFKNLSSLPDRFDEAYRNYEQIYEQYLSGNKSDIYDNASEGWDEILNFISIWKNEIERAATNGSIIIST